ncbi:DUF2069 domain-containing protein [Ectothiorhodospiraceae bacterium 2226]|nr:DUF2069 domain-containing protein [Ectothiorhodospiraceae bacterium 2226]
MTKTRWARITTLVGYFGLLILLLLWITLLQRPQSPISLVVLVWVVPLLFPLRGLLHARPYTHAWASFLALLYFVHGIGEVAAGGVGVYLGALEVLFSTLFWTGAVLFARFRGRELRLVREAAERAG